MLKKLLLGFLFLILLLIALVMMAQLGIAFGIWESAATAEAARVARALLERSWFGGEMPAPDRL